jgi:hypothetical protein
MMEEHEQAHNIPSQPKTQPSQQSTNNETAVYGGVKNMKK